MPTVDYCCGVVPLETATLITGIFGVLSSVVVIIFTFTLEMKIKLLFFPDVAPLIGKLVSCIGTVIYLIASIILIIGAVRKRKSFVLFWIIISIVTCAALLVSVIYTGIVNFSNDHNVTGSLILVFGICGCAFYAYLCVVVYSYFQVLTLEKNRGPYGRPLHR